MLKEADLTGFYVGARERLPLLVAHRHPPFGRLSRPQIY